MNNKTLSLLVYDEEAQTFRILPIEISGNDGKVIGLTAGEWGMRDAGDAVRSLGLSQFAGGSTTPAQLRTLIDGTTGTGNLVFADGDIGSASGTGLRLGVARLSIPSTGEQILIKRISAGGTRIHLEPSGFVFGTATKFDWMGDDFNANQTSYRLGNALFYNGPSPDGTGNTGGNGTFGFFVKGTGETWGIFPDFDFGFGDNNASGGAVMRLTYFDTSDTKHRPTLLPGFWSPGRAVTSGDYIMTAHGASLGKCYLAMTSGTTGPNKPEHTSGTVSDGGVEWSLDRDFSLTAANFRPCVRFGDRDQRHKFGMPNVRVQFMRDVSFDNGVMLNFLSNQSPIAQILWTLGATLNGTDIRLASTTVANAFLRLLVNSGKAAMSLNNMAWLDVAKSFTDGSATPDLAGCTLGVFVYPGPVTVTGFTNALGRQRVVFTTSNNNVTLQHSSTIVLPRRRNLQLKTGHYYHFHVDSSMGIFTLVGDSEGIFPDGLAVGASGPKVTGILNGTANIDLVSLNAGAEVTANINVAGALAAQTPTVQIGWSGTLPAGLAVMQSWVSADGVVSVRIRNFSGAPIDADPLDCWATVTQY